MIHLEVPDFGRRAGSCYQQIDAVLHSRDQSRNFEHGVARCDNEIAADLLGMTFLDDFLILDVSTDSDSRTANRWGDIGQRGQHCRIKRIVSGLPITVASAGFSRPSYWLSWSHGRLSMSLESVCRWTPVFGFGL